MLKMFILLMVSFLVLMSPYRLFALSMSLLSYNTDFSPEGWHLFYIQLTQWVTTIVFASNSIVNPILFNFLSTRFRLGDTKNSISLLIAINSSERTRISNSLYEKVCTLSGFFHEKSKYLICF